MCKMKLLVQSAVPLNVPGHLLLHVHLTSIYLIGDHIAKVLEVVHPGERVATQVHVS